MEPSKDKREEYKTYKELALGRSLKSRLQRTRIERRRVNRVIGGGELPYLEVNAQRYRAERLEITRQLLREAKAAQLDVPIEALMASLRHRIDRLTYERFATEAQAAARVEAAFVRHHGRQPTLQEKQRFIEGAAVGVAEPMNIAVRRRGIVDEVLAHVQNRQSNNPTRYQTAWAQVVGTEVAQQTQLDRIDPATGVAYFRCYNSALSYQLQRQPGVAQKLSRALGMVVRQVKVRN